MAQLESKSTAEYAISSNRNVTVDLFRGVAIVLMLLVSRQSPIIQLRHTTWEWFHIADLAVPFFLFIAGYSLALTMQRRNRSADSRYAVQRYLFLRIVRLFTVGLLLTMALKRDLTFSLGTLQCIAISLLVALPFVTRSVTAAIWGIVLLTTAYGSLLLFSPTEIISPPENVSSTEIDPRFTKHMTISDQVDRTLFGKERAEEGLLPSMVNASYILFGFAFAAGCGVRSSRELSTTKTTMIALGLVVVGCALASPLVPFHIPVLARIASPTFIFIASGISIALFLALKQFSRYPAALRSAAPILVLGQNALVAYISAKLFTSLVLNGISVPFVPSTMTTPTDLPTSELLGPWIRGGVAELMGPSAGAMTIPIVKILFAWVLCYVLAKRKIFVRV